MILGEEVNRYWPINWTQTRLEFLSQLIQYGYTASADFSESESKMLRITDIQDNKVNWSTVPHCKIERRDLEKYRLASGDIVFARSGATTGKSFQIETCPENSVFASYLIRVKVIDKYLNSKYLRYYFNTSVYWSYISENLAGNAQPNCNGTKLANLPVPLPPLPEQHRIVAKLDSILPRVEKVRKRLEKIPALVKRFRQSVLTAAVTGKLTERWRVKNPAAGEWKNISLGETLVDIRYGTAKKCGHESTGTPVLRIPNIVCGTINVDDLKFAEFDQREIDSLSVRQDDLLMIRSNGSVSLVGKTALVTSQVSGYLFAGYLIRLRLNKDFTSPRFLNYALNAPAIREHIERTSRSAAGVNNINSEEIKGIPIDFPPFDEQQEIVRQVDKLFSLADKLEARYHRAMARIEKFPQAILAKAFRGELVPQDPNDEPAEKLLELIRQEREKLESTPKSSGSRKPRRVSVKMGA